MEHLFVLLLGSAMLQVQEPPKLTLDEAGSVRDVVRALQTASRNMIRLDAGVEEKAIRLSVRDADFYQALDALCRAHGNLRYFPGFPGDGGRWMLPVLTLFPGAPTEYPGTYRGSFKVIVREMNRFRLRSAREEQVWTRLTIVVFAPSSLSIDGESGSDIHWTFEEAKDAAGRPVALRPGAAEEAQLVQGGHREQGNLRETSVTLEDFDLDQGLSVLKGKVELTVADAEDVRVPLDPGKPEKIPGGELTVEEVKQVGDGDWRILLEVRPADKKLRPWKLLEHRCRVDPDPGIWQYLPAGVGPSIELQVMQAAHPPQTIGLRVRGAERKWVVPFEIRDIRFKKDGR
jgi:hypothetical protein